MTEEQKYEYVVIYNPTKETLFRNRGRQIKQTLAGAQALVKWAGSRGYDIRLQRRAVGEWEDV